MLLKDLFRETSYSLLQGDPEREISDIVYDTRRVEPGCLFLCIAGTSFDPHNALVQIAEGGAAAVLVDRPLENLSEEAREALKSHGVTVLLSESPRRALPSLSVTWFGHPMDKLIKVGVTGTKGKTTTTHMLKYILEAAGEKVCLIGTNGVKIGEEAYPTRYTTPEAYDIQHFAAMAVEKGCRYLIMEVSSTGLKYGRVDGIFYDLGAFTNLSPDHIGGAEHKDFEDYMQAKSLLFRRCTEGVFNLDDPSCQGVAKDHTCRMITFGAAKEADYRLTGVDYSRKEGTLGCDLHVEGCGSMEFFAGIPGYFNAQNALCAAVLADRLGIAVEYIRKGLSRVFVNGRMEIVYSDEKHSFLVDYAHNGMSARILLETLRGYNPRRLVVVFGCGGNRDPHRRYEMGEASGRFADLSIVTADNSRFEEVENIMKDIHIGLDPTGGKYLDIPDRRQAIRYAVEHAEPGDIVAVIGKGHETYQEIKGVRTHFSDQEEILAALEVCTWK